jgi:Domain of unknown function (DUF4167)
LSGRTGEGAWTRRFLQKANDATFEFRRYPPRRPGSFAQRGSTLDYAKGVDVKRSRRGGRRPQGTHNGHNGGGGGGGGGSNNGGGSFNPNRTFDSNGPDIKIRGSASHVYEKYLQLARDANTQGDRVMAENYLQHAEHYFRILSAAQAQQQLHAAQQAQQNPQQQQPSANGNVAAPNGNGNGGYRPPQGVGEQPYIQGAPQPSFSLVDASAGLIGDEDEGEE